MNFKQYSRFNTIGGWLVFAIALFTYASTMEATVSLWDCGEFIPASMKLEVVHPPGAPFFLMFNHVFTLFAGSNDALVPVMVNFSSALMSAMASLFLFWFITAIAVKIVFRKAEEEIGLDQMIIVLASGIIGALAYTWSDTAWFSAVEGEVYAMSSMFIALVAWLMMKWERRATEKDHLRWIILISFFIGLSSGVHLMSLLAIPAMAVVYYYRFYSHDWMRLVLVASAGVVLLGIVQVVVVTGIIDLISRFEVLFVNSFNLPFWSGAFFVLIVMFGLLGYFIYRTYIKNQVVAHVALTSFLVILIGYSSYTMVVVRSMANPAIDMNDPQSVFSLLSYLNRDQYGDRPIVKGPNYTAYLKNAVDYEKTGRKLYRQGEEEYIAMGRKDEEKVDPKYTTIFPRMYSRQENHINRYKSWTNVRGNRDPSLGDNITFFVKYQLGHMWFRYFGWNFIGRQNDDQGHGSSFRGNYLTGLDGIDNSVLNVPPAGDKFPDHMREDKARNLLYGLPFLLGLIGLIFHSMKERKSFIYVLIYFGMTGIALAVYLNMPPLQPRERDYVFVASFYFFCVWIAMGIVAIWNWLREKVNPTIAAALVSVLGLLAIPVNMVAEEWDDHDRSNRYVPLAFGSNYLNSCAPNAILFTNGDNDTYPLWYAQEVEGIRDDIRIINLSLLNTDWYVNQMRHPINDADSIHMSIPPSKYIQGTRDYAIFNPNHSLPIGKKQHVELEEVLDFIWSDNKATKVPVGGGQMLDFFPTKNLKITVDKQAVISSGTVQPQDANKVVKEMKWKIRKSNLLKADLVLLDVIATNAANGWKRPIYWAITTGTDAYLNLMPYLQMEGLTYRLVPVKKERALDDRQPGRVQTDLMYDKVMGEFQWGGLDTEEDMWVDYVMMRQCRNFRNIFVRLSYALMMEAEIEEQRMQLSPGLESDSSSIMSKKARAVAVLDRGQEVIPARHVPYDAFMMSYSQLYYNLDQPEKAFEVDKKLAHNMIQEIEWYASLPRKYAKTANQSIAENLRVMRSMIQNARSAGMDENIIKEWQDAIAPYRQNQ